MRSLLYRICNLIFGLIISTGANVGLACGEFIGLMVTLGVAMSSYPDRKVRMPDSTVQLVIGSTCQGSEV